MHLTTSLLSPAPATALAIAPGREFLSLLMENQRGMYALICSLLGGSEHANDVLQETNVVLWEKAGEYDAARPFRPWAFRFAHNQVLAFRKKMQRDRLVFDDQMLMEIRDRTMTATERPGRPAQITGRLHEEAASATTGIGPPPLCRGEETQGNRRLHAAVGQYLGGAAVCARRAILRCMKARLAKEAEE